MDCHGPKFSFKLEPNEELYLIHGHDTKTTVWIIFGIDRVVAFLFVDHSSDCITVFFATVAGALSLALIVGVFVYYRQHENKHQLNVKEEPKLSGYGTNESKTLEEATNSFLLGPIKTPPPPEYVLEGYNWDPESTSSHKSVRNGSVSRHYNVKDVGSKNVGPREVNGHNRLVYTRLWMKYVYCCN